MSTSPSEFQRVKSLWQTRVGREAPRPPAPEASRVLDHNVKPSAPLTPVPTADSPTCRMDTNGRADPTTLDEATSVSPQSTSSTFSSSSSSSSSTESPPLSPVKSSAKSVASMFRTFSDACVFSSIKSRRLTTATAAGAPASAPLSSAAPSTFRSFAPPLPITWRGSRSVSDCAVPSTRSTFPFVSVTAAAAPSLLPREAAENAINNVHSVSSRGRPAAAAGASASAIFRGSPYGEVVLVDILDARGLQVDLPFVLTMQLSQLSRTTQSKSGRDHCSSVHERFVFWLPSSPANDQRTLDVFVHSGDGRDLGEVHLSLAMPLNETFTDSYPLVSRCDGLKHGSVQVAMRRLVLTSSPMLETAQKLSARDGCLSFSERNNCGESVPELWLCFPGTGPEGLSTGSPKNDDISSKFGRLIGFQDAAQRDVF
ncbi:unnamed protein product [Hyaloperonospora brassicae]|uniref:C2 NT-type domain-containing protein n=1 Tax=Hyaloperonospora brassicae TaxID=162125 RepID=A0AAV0V3T3_HYABA|nr:unnamed protein product [Hyaloperonospora brassicae]